MKVDSVLRRAGHRLGGLFAPSCVPTPGPTCVLMLALAGLCGGAHASAIVRQNGNEIEVEFRHPDNGAGSVAVAGSFNDWSVSSAIMTRSPEGDWRYVLHGVKAADLLQYKFVEGTSHRWLVDPDAPDTVSDFHGGVNGQVAVRKYLRVAGADELPADLADDGAILAAPAQLVPTAVSAEPGMPNLLAEAGFELDGLAGWTVRGDLGALSNERKAANAHSGERSLKYTRAKPFRALVVKRLTGLTPGTYALRAWASGGGGETALKLFARDCGGPVQSVAMVNSGWQKWRQYTVKGIQVKGGDCTIGFYVDAPAGVWGNIDDVEFQPDATWSRLSVETSH